MPTTKSSRAGLPAILRALSVTATDAADTDLAVHVLPINDLREHDAKITCWCWPDVYQETPQDALVVVHRRLDGREGREPKAPPLPGTRPH